MFSVRFADEPPTSGYNRNGFASLDAARAWAIEYLRQQNAIKNNPFVPVLLVVDDNGNVRDDLTRCDPRVVGKRDAS